MHGYECLFHALSLKFSSLRLHGQNYQRILIVVSMQNLIFSMLISIFPTSAVEILCSVELSLQLCYDHIHAFHCLQNTPIVTTKMTSPNPCHSQVIKNKSDVLRFPLEGIAQGCGFLQSDHQKSFLVHLPHAET